MAWHSDNEVMEAAREVAEGEPVSVVAARHGVVPSTVSYWLKKAGRIAKREEERRRAAMEALKPGPGEVVIVEADADGGTALVMVDARDASRASGTMRWLAGAPPRKEGAAFGGVRRVWSVDVRVLSRAIAAYVSGTLGSDTSYRSVLGSMLRGGVRGRADGRSS